MEIVYNVCNCTEFTDNAGSYNCDNCGQQNHIKSNNFLKHRVNGTRTLFFIAFLGKNQH